MNTTAPNFFDSNSFPSHEIRKADRTHARYLEANITKVLCWMNYVLEPKAPPPDIIDAQNHGLSETIINYR